MMTTGTGAVGLNLAVANFVYIIEPQWNPMVESQAIARVARLGQKKNVSVIRYIMKGTIEEVSAGNSKTWRLSLEPYSSDFTFSAGEKIGTCSCWMAWHNS